jgi:hypothetical protein
MLACTTAIAMAPEGVARADASCARVQASSELAGPWLDAVHELERQIAQLPPSDCQAATLQIEPTEGAARVVAITPDGRRAERVVRAPAGLVATGLGLVMAIPLAPQASTPPAPAIAPAASNPPPPAPVPGPAVIAAVAPPRLGLWLGLDAGGRTAVPASIAAADVSVHGDIVLDHWLFTIAIRDSVVGFSPGQGVDNDTFREVNVGLGVGRRLTVGETAFDLVLAPAITAMRLEWDYPGDKDASGEDVELSVNALARVAVPISKSWALTLTVESELVPSNLSSPAHIEPPAGVPPGATQPPPFPAWTGGLRIGAMGAIL